MNASIAPPPPAAFGTRFTTHMVVQRWQRGAGWDEPQLTECAAFPVHPATAVLHYGQSIFEGAKAFLSRDGSVRLFRPAAHAARFARSARRMAMPVLPEEVFVAALTTLVDADRDELPADTGAALYLRPYLLAADARLGAATPPDSFLFGVIACATPPPAPYVDIPALRVWVCDNYVRAAPGGTGDVKTAANYALGLLGQSDAVANGCDQVLWLDAHEHRYVQELGAMNVFLVRGRGDAARLVTPPLDGCVLPGITRDSVLAIAADLDMALAEEPIALDDWRGWAASAEVTEAFATGTASGIKPIGAVRHRDTRWTVPDTGRPVTTAVAERLRSAYLGAVHPEWGLSVQAARPDAHGPRTK